MIETKRESHLKPFILEICQEVKEELMTLLQNIQTFEALQKVVKNLKVPVCVTEQYGELLVTNDAFCKLYHDPESKLVGEHYTSVVPIDKKPEAVAFHNEVASGFYRSYRVCENITIDNEILHVIIVPLRFIDIHGNIFIVSAVMLESSLSNQVNMDNIKERIKITSNA